MNAIYMTNTNETNVLANAIVPCSVNKRAGGQGAFIFLNNAVIVRKPGYYEINATVTVTAAEAGNVTIELRNNGITVDSITATETITTPDTEIRTLALHGFIKFNCCQDPAVLSLYNASDVAITTTNVSFSVIG